MNRENTIDSVNAESVGNKAENTSATRNLLAGEIAGVETSYQAVAPGDTLAMSTTVQQQAIYFMMEGEGVITLDGEALEIGKLTVFSAKPGSTADLKATTVCRLLQVITDLRPEESQKLDDAIYPILLKYEDCEKYRDYFKSQKTISRTLVEPYTLHRFCMGTVETTGPDLIEPHNHPMLDQMFFSMPENDCTLLVDGDEQRYGGSCLLHIPLGSDHGVRADEGDVVHYLWMDFFQDVKDMEYIVKFHKPVDE